MTGLLQCATAPHGAAVAVYSLCKGVLRHARGPGTPKAPAGRLAFPPRRLIVPMSSLLSSGLILRRGSRGVGVAGGDPATPRGQTEQGRPLRYGGRDRTGSRCLPVDLRCSSVECPVIAGDIVTYSPGSQPASRRLTPFKASIGELAGITFTQKTHKITR